MLFTDTHGLEFTASSETSAALFGELTSAYLGLRPQTGGILKQLLADDPEMPMAICAKGYFAKLRGSAKQASRAKTTSTQLLELIQTTGASSREQLHANALAAWCDGYLDQATQIWEQILGQFPLDGMALNLAHYSHFYSGDPQPLRESIARVLPKWSPDHPNYGCLLGMYAFGLEECGDYDTAELYGRRAVELNPADAWAVHAVAHVMEMTGRGNEGINWITELEPHWSTTNNFRFHLYWHQSLFHLERGEYEQAIALYDQQVISDLASDFSLDMCNAASLLWRLELHGVDVGNRWRGLVEFASPHVDDRELIFVSLHYWMVALSAQDKNLMQLFNTTFNQWAEDNTTQGNITKQVGLTIAHGLEMARNQNKMQSTEIIASRMDQLHLIGGSKAQRDLFYMIMLEGAKHHKDHTFTEILYSQRLGQKSHSSWLWQQYGEWQTSVGKSAEAKVSLEKSEQLRTHSG